MRTIKVIFTCFLIVFKFQTIANSDNIKDFQIEGLSVGESLLNFATEKEILDTQRFLFPNKRYAVFVKVTPNSENYDGYQVYYDAKDKNYEIHRLGGMIIYEKNFNECFKKQDEIVDNLSEIFTKVKKTDVGTFNHEADKSGKSKVTQVIYFFDDGSDISVECYDWSEKMNFTDKLAVSITSKYLRKHLDSGEAYKND